MLMSGYRAAAGKLIWKWLPTDFKRLIIKLMTKTIIVWDFDMHLGKHLDHKHPELSKEWHHVNFLLSVPPSSPSFSPLSLNPKMSP